MPLSDPYCTLLQLQKEIKNTDADDESDVLAWHEDCINRASRMVDELTQRDFIYHDYSSDPLVVPPEWVCGRRIYLPWPVITLTQIVVDDEVEDNDDWKAFPGKVEIIGYTDWPKPDDYLDVEDLIQLTGTFGYVQGDGSTAPPTDPAFPESVRRATVLIAASLTGDNRKEVAGLDGSKVSLMDTRIPEEAYKLLRIRKKRFW